MRDYDVFFDNGDTERVVNVRAEYVAAMDALYQWANKATNKDAEPPGVVDVRELVKVGAK